MGTEPNYVIGSGKLYFAPFVEGTQTSTKMERYLGNSPELSTSQSEETVEHYDADNGKRKKDREVTISSDTSGSFTLDDINMENVALWFGGAAAINARAAATGQTETFESVTLGSFLQIGVSAASPQGIRQLASATLTAGGDAVTATGNFTVDLVLGRIHILPNAADITAGDDIVVTYAVTAHSEVLVVPGGTTIEGRLVFIANNAEGANVDYVWPWVKVRPDGDLPLKGEDWQSLTYSFEALSLSDGSPTMQASARPVAS